MYKCDEIVNQGKAGSQVTSLPQVKNLDQRIVTFLANGKRFLEKSHELLCIFYDLLLVIRTSKPTENGW